MKVVEIINDLSPKEVVEMILDHYINRLDSRLRLVLEINRLDEGDLGAIEVIRIESMLSLRPTVGDMVARTVTEEEQCIDHHLQSVRNARERHLVKSELA